MIIIDAFLRYSGLGLLLFFSVLILRDLRHSTSSVYLLLANLSIASHFLGFTPDIFHLPYYFRMVLRFLDIFLLVFIWLFALSLFQKDFRLKTFHLLVAFACSFPMFMERLVQFRFIEGLPAWWALLVNSLCILLVVHMLTVTIMGRSDDLIEKRRKSRIYLVLMSAFSIVSVVVMAHILLITGLNHQYQPTVNVVGIWPAIIWISFWLSSINENKFSFDDISVKQEESLSSRDTNLLEKLNFEIIEKQSFLENKLTIESLAKRLGVSAYRLRGFINQTLGYKNFSSYINVYRIEAIKKTLANSEQQHIPILTIAMQHGFNSLSPFNRAFKSIEGMTPTEFRQKFKQLA